MAAAPGRKILGLGVDVVRVSRLRTTYARFGDRFLRRAFAPSEVEQFRRRGPPDSDPREPTQRQVEFLASRWAAKEATFKALGEWRVGLLDPENAFVSSDGW